MEGIVVVFLYPRLCLSQISLIFIKENNYVDQVRVFTHFLLLWYISASTTMDLQPFKGTN